jgi:hypothetical protein
MEVPLANAITFFFFSFWIKLMYKAPMTEPIKIDYNDSFW